MLQIHEGQCGMCTHFGEHHQPEPALIQVRTKHEAPAPPPRPSILFITMDTTRADAMRPEIAPSFLALAKRGMVFTQA